MEQPNGDKQQHGEPQPIFIIVMGVSGTGKSTLGSAVAQALDMPYVEGDDLHPQANIDKMANGQPLSDADREPWLALIRRTALKVVGEAKRGGVVISCSSLKVYYRDILRGDLDPVSASASVSVSKETPPSQREAEVVEHAKADDDSELREKSSIDSGESNPNETRAPIPHLPTYFVFIDGPREVLIERMVKRPGHFMKASMLDSQLATLESPVGEKGVVIVSVLDSTEDQVKMALQGLNLVKKQ